MLLLSICSVHSTDEPTAEPTSEPTWIPSNNPTAMPSFYPTAFPSFDPTVEPTEPTLDPTDAPSTEPSLEPTDDPSMDPTQSPSAEPTMDPTDGPTTEPTTGTPTASPSTGAPTEVPTTSEPTAEPTTSAPTTMAPTGAPTIDIESVCTVSVCTELWSDVLPLDYCDVDSGDFDDDQCEYVVFITYDIVYYFGNDLGDSFNETLFTSTCGDALAEVLAPYASISSNVVADASVYDVARRRRLLNKGMLAFFELKFKLFVKIFDNMT